MEKVPQQNEVSRQRIEEIFQHVKPDAIAVFSMDIVAETTKIEGYKSGSYANLDIRGLVSGGKADVIAAAEAAKYFPDAIIVTDTRDSDPSRGRPTHAQVYAREIQRLGVPKERIVLEENSINTITELVELIKMAVARNWDNLAIILNDFHIERTQEMLNLLPSLADTNDQEFVKAFQEFNNRGGNIRFVNAEDILVVRNPRYARLLEVVRNTDAYKARVQAEKQGTEDLRKKTYKIG